MAPLSTQDKTAKLVAYLPAELKKVLEHDAIDREFPSVSDLVIDILATHYKRDDLRQRQKKKRGPKAKEVKEEN